MRYNNMVVHKNCISERKFDNYMTEQIRSRNQVFLAKRPPPIVAPSIQEFYTNVKDYRKLKFFIQGKWIQFYRASINKFYKTQDIDNDAYSQICDEIVDLEEILRVLAKPRTTWKRSSTDVTNFSAYGMWMESKPGHHSICTKLLPSSKFSEITKEKPY